MWHRRAQASRCSSSSSAEAPSVGAGAPRLSGILLILGSVVAFYLAAEGATRLANVVWLKPQGEPTKPTRMWHQRYGRLNGFGYRDSEFESRRASDELRVLVLGDSFTYGTGVADPADLFTTVLARELAGTGRFAGVRFFNAGEPGADSAVELRHLAELLWLQPDLVILAYVFNDIEHVARFPLGDTPFGASSMASRFRPHRLLMLNSHFFDQVLLRYRRAWRGCRAPSPGTCAPTRTPCSSRGTARARRHRPHGIARGRRVPSRPV